MSSDTRHAVEAALDRTESEADAQTVALEQCLGHLPEPARRLLRLRYSEDLSLDVLAQRLASSLTAVTKALSRLRGQLETCIRDQLKRQEGA